MSALYVKNRVPYTFMKNCASIAGWELASTIICGIICILMRGISEIV